MRKLLSYLRIGLTAGVAILYTDLVYFRKYSRHPEKYPLEVRYKRIRKLVTYVLKCFRVDYHIDGLEKFSDLHEKCMIICNHHSDADPLIMVALSPKPITFVSKKEAFDYPIVGRLLKLLNAFSLDRENLMNQIHQIRDIVIHLKDPTKPNIVIYLEGTRNKEPEKGCLPFHAGTLKIAKMAGVRVLPFAKFGSSRILTKNSYLKHYPLHAKFLDFVDYSKFNNFDSTLEAENMRNLFDQEIDKLRTLDFEYINKQKISKKRKQLETKIDIERMS